MVVLLGKIFNTRDEFIDAIQKAWAGIDDGVVLRLMRSMPERVKTCLERNGGYIGK